MLNAKELPDKAAGQIKTLFLEIAIKVSGIAIEHQLDPDDVLAFVKGTIEGFLEQEVEHGYWKETI